VAKATQTQRSFVLGVVSEGFLEGDDIDLRQASLRGGKNVRVEATRTVIGRPGLEHVAIAPGDRDMIEIRPESDLRFGLVIGDGFLRVIDGDGEEVWSEDPAPWDDGGEVWVEAFREKTVIGWSGGLHVLTYDDGDWSFDDFVFADAPGGELAQPYWVFRDDLTMTPSALTGTITLTASAAFWTADYVGERVRYGNREILITAITNATVAVGTVISALPPSFRIELNSAGDFRLGDAVVGADSGFQGLVVAVAGNEIDVATITYFDGPLVDEKLSSPSGSSKVTGTSAIAPVASPIWDEPLISPVRGYPRAAASAAGRLTFVDFPQVPDVICMSSARAITDFETGAEDDDAIVRQVGDNAPRFLHVVNAGDLILMSDRGLYYVEIRNGAILTPLSFNAILFDKRAANSVRPASVDDGVVFVEASGKAVSACLLDGNYYLKWSVRTISTYHAALITAPVKLCGPSLTSERPEKYLFVVNGDGTMAAMSWFEGFNVENIGFIPWDTNGLIRSASPIFGDYWMIVDREVNGDTVRMIERLNDGMVVDGAVALSDEAAIAATLAGATVQICGAGWYAGSREVGNDGTVPDTDDLPDDACVGRNFDAYVSPWPFESVQSSRAGMLKARLVRGSVSVQHAERLYVRANRTIKEIGGPKFGEDPSEGVMPVTRVYRFNVIGNRDHPELEVGRADPGQFRILAITQEVQV
jgi:hypothetical protein